MSDAQHPEELDEGQALEALADCIYEYFQRVPFGEQEDPFEYYAHQLRGNWYKDRTLFIQRFLKGYRLMITSSS